MLLVNYECEPPKKPMSQHAQDRFPNRRDEINYLYLCEPGFRGLCHDYGVCVELLRSRESAPSRGTTKRADQLREMQLELEREIIEFLNENATLWTLNPLERKNDLRSKR